MAFYAFLKLLVLGIFAFTFLGVDFHRTLFVLV